MARATAVNGATHQIAMKVERNSKNELAAWSIFAELSPEGAAPRGGKRSSTTAICETRRSC